MPFFDLPLNELQRYLPPREEPDDFDAFWQQTLAEEEFRRQEREARAEARRQRKEKKKLEKKWKH